jgi:TPR repeat protein
MLSLAVVVLTPVRCLGTEFQLPLPDHCEETPYPQQLVYLREAHARIMGPEPGEAVKWLTQQLAFGRCEALTVLWDAYRRGRGVTANPALADAYLQAGVDLKTPSALGEYANSRAACCNQEYVQRLRQLAEGGWPLAMADYGIRLIHGSNPEIKQDWQHGLSLVKQAADAGHIGAYSYLGSAFLAGAPGLQIDPVKARNYLEIAAAAKDSLAIYNLGIIYLNGQGVARDHERAFKLFVEAADLGYGPAAFSLANRMINGEGTRQDPAAAVRVMRRGAELGMRETMRMLGMFYLSGLGDALPRDDVAGIAWLREAASRGDGYAMWVIGWLSAQGLLAGLPKLEAEAWLQRAAAAGVSPAEVEDAKRAMTKLIRLRAGLPP